MYKAYEWEFNREVSECFDTHVRQSVLSYDYFHERIATISKYFIEDYTIVLDIGTSTGELISKLPKNETCRYIGIDTSLPMIENAKQKLGSSVELRHANFLTYSINNCSVVTAMLVLQFIDYKDKQKFLSKVYESLNTGGALFLVDKIKASNTVTNDIYNDLYYDFKLDQGISPEDVLAKNQSLRGVQKTLTLQQNMDLLYSAGFKKIDIFMSHYNFVGIIAIK